MPNPHNYLFCLLLPPAFSIYVATLSLALIAT